MIGKCRKCGNRFAFEWERHTEVSEGAMYEYMVPSQDTCPHCGCSTLSEEVQSRDFVGERPFRFTRKRISTAQGVQAPRLTREQIAEMVSRAVRPEAQPDHLVRPLRRPPRC